MNIISKIAIVFLIIVGVMAFLQPADAADTDLILTPTAGIIENQGAVGAERIGSDTRIYGLFKLENFIEIGGQVIDKPQEPELGILLKTRLIAEGDGRPDIAVGIRGRSLYAVGSLSFYENTRGHFGLSDSSMGGIFFGIDHVINPHDVQIVDEEGNGMRLPRTRIMAEYLDEEFNFGARMNFTPELSVELSLIGLDKAKAGVHFNF
ncbi:hypothetical protein I0Q91_11775 [Halanaerobiaceae bacterium Z-7014]|uniref:Uncharacterized protein n=1 Tax=Halonatronomonas betaini TaxID=2778430 RepID=A0A931AWF7_9FIRM|nr:hypothetical protein [Halonatronomonas betaini]MBF8437765.1 hypothetical protein [Halonatronomonas betaini]